MGARILVIEDNPANLELMMYLLRALGHNPISALDGSDGLASARERAPDLVVCDVQLPHMDGYEVARRMKSDPVLSGIPIVAVTAFAMPGDRERALAAGFNGYVSKPITPERFMQQIGEFLSPEARAKSLTDNGARAGILVIEHDQLLARRIRRALEDRGFEAFLAHSVDEARHLGVEDQVDLVLLGAPFNVEDVVETGCFARDRILWPTPPAVEDLLQEVELALAEQLRAT